jgi:hypothetical protein
MERREYKCTKCGGVMVVEHQFTIAGSREPTGSETLSGIITLLGEVAKYLPEQSVPSAKVQAAIRLLEAMPCIQGMRERVRQLKGEFSLQSGKGGTSVTALLPAPGCPGDSGTREERAS